MISTEKAFKRWQQDINCDDIMVNVNSVPRTLVLFELDDKEMEIKIIDELERLCKKAPQKDREEIWFAFAKILPELGSKMQDPIKLITLFDHIMNITEPKIRDILDMREKEDNYQTSTIRRFLGIFNYDEIKDVILKTITNLLKSNNFQLKINGIHMIPVFIEFINNNPSPNVNEINEELKTQFQQSAEDESPLVKMALGNKLEEMAAALTFYPREKAYQCKFELLVDNVLHKLVNDEQDSVKINAIVNIGNLNEDTFKKPDLIREILPMLTSLAKDKSWRVRMALAQNFRKISLNYGEKLNLIELAKIIETLLKDKEADIQIQALKTYQEMIENDNIVPIKLYRLFNEPILEKLIKSSSSKVQK